MLIEVVGSVEEQLRDLSCKEGKDIGVLVEDAIREYLDARAISDLDAEEVATTQVALAGELRGMPPDFPDLKGLLLAMPGVGDDEDFARLRQP